MTPKTNQEQLMNKSMENLNPYKVETTAMMPNAYQSTTVASTAMHNNKSNYKQMKITPLDFMNDESLEEVKHDRSNNTILRQRNFKYFVKQPHIHFGGISVKNLDTQSMNALPTTDLMRPTS